MSVRIFVTGDCGYIGSTLTRMLNINGLFSVCGYDIKTGHDIRDYSNLLKAMQECQPDIVIHLADTINPDTCLSVNAIGTRNVVRAMQEVDCYNIIYASTGEVYGDQQNPLSEDLPLLPRTKYACSKTLSEFVIWNHFFLQKQGNYLIYRIFTVAGPSGFPDIDNLQFPNRNNPIQDFLRGQVTIYGKHHKTSDGTQEIDVISLQDVCQAFIQGIIKLGCTQWGLRGIINISSGIPVSIKEIIKIWNNIARDLVYNKDNRRLPFVSYNYEKKRLIDISRCYGANIYTRKILKWEPYHRLEDIIYDLSKQLNGSI